MPAFTFKIESGNVQGRESLWASIKRIFSDLPDGEYIWPHPEKKKRGRSTQQNAYMWGVVYNLISKHTGYTPDEVHQILAETFLSYEKDGRTFIRSTTRLKTAEFEQYMEKCRRWAAMELQVYCPLPNEPDNFFYDVPKKEAA